MQPKKEINGTSFSVSTPDTLCNLLNELMTSKRKVKIYLGDTGTGECWAEENDIIGFIGRSTGSSKIPLLLTSLRSNGGGSVLDNCILAVRTANSMEFLYKADNFQLPTLEIKNSKHPSYVYDTFFNGKLHSRHLNKSEAEKVINIMK